MYQLTFKFVNLKSHKIPKYPYMNRNFGLKRCNREYYYTLNRQSVEETRHLKWVNIILFQIIWLIWLLRDVFISRSALKG
jgi:hypothetical protein